MRDISKDIVEKIKNGNIVPDSKFILNWRNYAFWFLMIAMIILGALSLSLVILNVTDLHPDFLRFMGFGKFMRLIFATAPHLWILLLLSTLFFGFLSFRKTTRGYRKSTLFVTSLIVLAVFTLGMVSHILKIDNRMGQTFSENAPRFKGMIGPREGRWLRPGDGLIGGDIMQVGEGGFSLKSFDGQEWKIVYDEKTETRGVQEIAVGKKIGVIGKKVGEFEMHAFSMRSFPDDWNGKPPRREKSPKSFERDSDRKTGGEMPPSIVP